MTTSTAVAIRCTEFLDAFQANVAKKQIEIEEMNDSQGEYMAVHRAMVKEAIPNSGEVLLTTSGAHVRITALPTDHSSLFEKFARAIGSELIAMRLHDDGIPALGLSDCWYDITYTFRTKRKSGKIGSVTIYVALPGDGIRDLKVERTEKMERITSYRVVPRDHSIAPPLPDATVHEPPASSAISAFDYPF